MGKEVGVRVVEKKEKGKKWGERNGEEGKGNGAHAAPLGESTPWDFCLEAFIRFLQAGIIGEASGEDFSRILISSPGAALSGSWSPLIGQGQSRGSLVFAVGSGIAYLVLLLFWAWRGKGTLGVRVLFCPLLGTQGLLPW